MKITGFDTLHGAAVRCLSFLKITTDTGITGWSEFTGINERNRRMGLDSLIHAMMRSLVGRDPREIERISSDLLYDIKVSQSGLNHQALGALQTCIIDITAKFVKQKYITNLISEISLIIIDYILLLLIIIVYH